MCEQSAKRARAKALALLTGRDYTEAGLRSKLAQKGFDQAACDDAVSYVKRYGYLDDERYADRYIELHRDSASRRRIAAELKEKKGVPSDVLEAALGRAGEWDEKPLIRKLAEKKFAGRPVSDPVLLQKVTAALVRRGFNYRDIREVLDGLEEEENGECPERGEGIFY